MPGRASEEKRSERRASPSSRSSPVREIEPPCDFGRSRRGGAESASSPGRARARSRAPSPSYTPASEDSGGAAGWSKQRRAARADPSVGEREQRLVHALELGVDPVDRRASRPGRGRPRGRRRADAARADRRAARGSASGPPPSAITAAGAPVGSAPTETASPAAASGTSRNESLPGSPPSGPNSSPATARARADPRAPQLREDQRAESALSVRPISTCLASLVTRGSARPAASAPRRARARPPRRGRRGRPRAAAPRPPPSSSAIRAFGGSAHSGSGIRSILRRLSRCETISRADAPRAASSSTVAPRPRRALRPPRASPRAVDQLEAVVRPPRRPPSRG